MKLVSDMQGLSDNLIKMFFKRHNHFVYVFWNEYEQVIYVGRTKNFLNRWRSHKKDSRFISLYKVTVFAYETESESMYSESQGIAHYRPVYNISGVKESKSRIRFNPLGTIKLKVEIQEQLKLEF